MGQTSSAVQDEQDNKGDLSFEERFQQMLSGVEIPRNIAPELVNLWLERERENFKRQEEPELPPNEPTGLSLDRVLAAFIGVIGMIVTIVLGLVRADDMALILRSACFSLVLYSVIGFIAGLIAEHCLRESAEALAREIVVKSDQLADPVAEET